MAGAPPQPITDVERRQRLRRVERIARALGFVGRIEYRHEFRGAGGAQFGLARRPEDDLLVVDAQAFERAANPDDFSLEAIIAHERGRQLLHRQANLSALLSRWNGHSAEEMLASVIGSMLVTRSEDQQALMYKAVGEALRRGVAPTDAVSLVNEIRLKLENWL